MPKLILKVGISIGISFVIVALLLQMLSSGLSDDQRPSVFEALRFTNLNLVGTFIGISIISLFVRAVRYHMLLQMSGEENVPTLRQMALVTGVRNMVVDMLPGRIGELGYVALLSRGYGVKLQHSISSLTVAVAFDFIAMVGILMLIILFQANGAGVAHWAINAAISALVLTIIAVFGLFIAIPWVSRWFSVQFPASSDAALLAKLQNLLNDFSASLIAVRSAGKTIQIISLSVFIRVLKYTSFYLLFEAVARPSFTELAALPSSQILSALIGGELAASLPTPTFMSFGAYEAGGALVFKLLGIANQAQAAVTLLCVHIWSQLMDYILGGVLLVTFLLLKRGGESYASATESAKTSKLVKRASYAMCIAVLGFGSMFLAYQIWASSKLGALTPPPPGSVVDNAEQQRKLSSQQLGNLKGFAVFSSNRDGNHDIFRLDLATLELRKITTHPHTETYPRISPDGSMLVFARAHQPWVSLRNTVAWDIILLDLATGQERTIGHGGTAPAWISQHEITYAKDSVRMVKFDLRLEAEEVLFESGIGNSMPTGAFISNPKYNPETRQVAFTARQSEIGMHTGHWGTAIVSENAHKGILEGCEISWDTANAMAFQVASGGKHDDLRIVELNPSTMSVRTLIDLDGEFSHEYWPKDSANGADYMIFGASRSKQEHEHDIADYEIFLWKKNTASNRATRLTFHSGNDNWPDVYVEQ